MGFSDQGSGERHESREKEGWLLQPCSCGEDKKTLEYALCRLYESVLSPYITNVYLYGSCTRGEQTYKSDVDLLVEFSEDIDPIKCGPDIIQLKGDISPSSLEFPEVDMHVVIGDGWRNSKKLYHQNVRREGIEIWGTQKIHT